MASKRREENRKRGDAEERGSGWSGSPAHTERHGKHGEKGESSKGAGELQMSGPGRMAARITPHGSGMPNEKAASGAPPKGMKRYTEE